jgi:hypothetical protein
MLTPGLEKFKEYFNGFENQYVLIGGTACSVLFDEYGSDFRSTKDIDMVLIVEALVLFKIKAWLDLSNRKSQGENIDTSDIKKHKNDIFRLSTIIIGTEIISLSEDGK